MKITLKKGAKLYLNGAVIRADQKVNIELLNDATFLLSSHVLPAESARTPISQLYFVLQSTMMKPTSAEALLPAIRIMITALKLTLEASELRDALEEVESFAINRRYYDALRRLRPFISLQEQSEECAEENAA
jgi:flagellar protein FlbT